MRNKICNSPNTKISKNKIK